MTTTNLKTINAIETVINDTQLSGFAVLNSKNEHYDLPVNILVKRIRSCDLFSFGL